MNQEDSTFLKQFSWVIIGLAIFTVVIIVLANIIHSTLTPAENPSREAQRLDRIKPIAGVYVGEEALAAASAADSAPSTSMDSGADSIDGAAIYQQVCSACHTTGAAGAPKLEAAAWQDRLSKGADQLVSSAINGIGVMPAKGGRADLSDDEIRATVEWMLAEVNGGEMTATEEAVTAESSEQMAAAETMASDIDGSAIYQSVCAACHSTGAAGAPKLEASAWADRKAKGTDALVSSAINGIGIMPAKGGRADLSDDEVRATVEWMLSQAQ